MTKRTQYPIERPVVMTDEVAEAIRAVADKAELEGKGQRKVSADLLNKAVLLDVTYHMWTNRAKADALPESNSRAEKSKAREDLNMTMRLIKSPALDAIITRNNEVKNWISVRCMPSFLVNGIKFALLEVVEEFEREISEYNDWLTREGVPALQADWERAKAQAKNDYAEMALKLGINNPYNEGKYPDPRNLREKFGIDHSWVTFGVPASLPAAIREQESIKIRAKYEEAAQEIDAALREGFATVINHAVEQLTVKPGEGKRVIKESLVENFREFCETFRFRNLTDASDLEALVKQAEQIMSATDARTLRERPRARGQVLAQLNTIKAAVDEMIVAAPRRKFDLDALDE